MDGQMIKWISIVGLLFFSSCPGHIFKSWVSAYDLCVQMCDSSGQDYSEVLQYSMGTCICNNDEGRKVAEGYHRYLNDSSN
jgi:hypothetical protein